jgi:hypothetical protein
VKGVPHIRFTDRFITSLSSTLSDRFIASSDSHNTSTRIYQGSFVSRDSVQASITLSPSLALPARESLVRDCIKSRVLRLHQASPLCFESRDFRSRDRCFFSTSKIAIESLLCRVLALEVLKRASKEFEVIATTSDEGGRTSAHCPRSSLTLLLD